MNDLDLAPLDQTTKDNVLAWLNAPLSTREKEWIRSQAKENVQELVDPFHTNLVFGTGGMRGLMGVGPNRMNLYTVGAATQGLANYIKKNSEFEKSGVFISYDSRNHSREFAFHAARVLAGNGVKSYITTELRPTPFVSFGCRHLNCQAAIMITASHNPKAYNGYKVYWSDGAQVTSPHDKGIIANVVSVDPFSEVSLGEEDAPLIEIVGAELDKTYIDTLFDLQILPKQNTDFGSHLNVCFSPLHGTGATLIGQILKGWGFNNLSFVKEQMEPDGNFPTCTSPNPEDLNALQLGIEMMKKEGCDLLLATDPDADRIGVVASHEGKPHALNGNQIATLIIHHICEKLKSVDRLPTKGAFATTIVTTPLLKELTRTYQLPCFEVLTGFKYIGRLIKEWESEDHGYQFLFGAEESYGFLFGTHARDKDALITAGLLCEIALDAKLAKTSLIDILESIYEEYGYYREKQLSVTFENSVVADHKVGKLMDTVRNTPPTHILGEEITTIVDYMNQKSYDLITGKTSLVTLPKSNVLSLATKNGTKLIIRPSGTEPKIKLYGFSRELSAQRAEKRVNNLLSEAKSNFSL